MAVTENLLLNEAKITTATGFIDSFIPSFNKQLLSVYYAVGMFLTPGHNSEETGKSTACVTLRHLQKSWRSDTREPAIWGA